MIRLGLVLVASFMCSLAWGQSTSIRSLFQNSSLVPGTLIPFQVRGNLMDGGARISKVLITANSASADCRLMLDLFHKDVFLLKCKSATNLQLLISLSHANGLTQVAYGPLEIKLPGAGLVIVDPSTTADPNWIAGKALFSRCIECHTPNNLRGRTANQIYTATFSTSSPGYKNMNSRSDVKSLTDTQRKQIEHYLSNPTRGQ